MTSRTFADRNVKWHTARLSASLHGVFLCLSAAFVLIGSSLIHILDGGGHTLLPEWAFSAAIGGAGWHLTRHARPADAPRHRWVAVAVSLFGAFLAVIEIPILVDAASPTTTGLIRISIFLTALASSIGATRVFLLLRAASKAPPPHDLRYPASEQDIINLIREARDRKLRLRVHGSEHSVYSAIGACGESRGIDVSLARLNRIVEWDEKNRRVRVEAGCVLGVDPASPASTRENSLLHQLDRRGWALPLTGGITHQTVAGFLSTGSSGGSVTHSLGDCIERLRLVDGTGSAHELAPDPNDPNDEIRNPFYAAGVSLGLLGVITEVTFQCQERFDVSGSETTSAITNAAIQLVGEGDRGLAASFRRIEYCRLMWWPQRGIERLQIWQAARIPDSSAEPLRPYVQIPGGRIAQILLGSYFRFANRSSRRPVWMCRLMNWIMWGTIPLGKVSFRGPWLGILPMDNEVDNDLLPVSFSELWIELDRAADVAKTLDDYYAGDIGCQRAGSFACELYAAKRSRFWLSPSYGRDTIRVDLMHIEHGRVRPETEYFPQFWSLLERFQPRYHWGKQMPPPGRAAGSAYFTQVYPRWDDFLTLRSQLDPGNIFVSEYWGECFGVDQPGPHLTYVEEKLTNDQMPVQHESLY